MHFLLLVECALEFSCRCLVNAKLAEIVLTHHVQMAAFGQHRCVVASTGHLLDDYVEAAGLGRRVVAIQILVLLLVLEAELSARIRAPDEDFGVAIERNILVGCCGDLWRLLLLLLHQNLVVKVDLKFAFYLDLVFIVHWELEVLLICVDCLAVGVNLLDEVYFCVFMGGLVAVRVVVLAVATGSIFSLILHLVVSWFFKAFVH